MKKAYDYAVANGFDWFTTTLSISPFKDAKKINTTGNALQTGDGTKFLTGDFKKKSGFLRSLELSREFGLYRQTYCGCIYSLQNTHHT
jgi:epoxyqueuosine reductase